jgi:uncharacterized protein YndB with AHSA1/START domain
MTERSVHHATFVIERRYPTSPARVFKAWADRDAKRRWYACHDDWHVTHYELDFRVGGRESLDTGPAGEQVHRYNALYHDIVPNERIIYSYDMRLDERRISVSLATVEFKSAGSGTRMIFTEQLAMLDGYDDLAGREEGTRIGLDNLGRQLSGS